MAIIDRFKEFAADFEATVQDDDWNRLERHFTHDATYQNVGGPDPLIKGRERILAFLKKDVSENDRKFESRTLIALSEPVVRQNRLSRRWQCTYTLTRVPDLVVEGEARYLFEGELIKAIEEEVSSESMEKYAKWMQEYGSKLRR